MTHHSPSIILRGASGEGVAVIQIQETLTEGWKKGKRGGKTVIGGTTRMIRVDIKISNATKIKISKWNKTKLLGLSLVSSYHPTTGYKMRKSNNMPLIS